MSWLNGPWRSVACLTHLSAPAQRRLWRGLILAWAVLLLTGWAALSVFTRVAEKACEEAGQTYVTVAPLAAEVMDLRARNGQRQDRPPLLAAEQVARTAGIGPDRLRLLPVVDAVAPGGGQSLSLRAQALSLRELVALLRDLRVEAGLSTVSAHMAPAPGRDTLMDLDLVLSR